jgi:peptidoglycan glycosyltransferase
MNRQISRLAAVALALLASLVVATTYWQAWAAGGLADKQDNAIQRVAQFSIERGEFLAGDGKTVLARSVPQEVAGRTLYFRRYPQGGLAAHAVGYSTQSRARAGLERSLNSYLTASNANLSTVIDTTLDRLQGATVQGNDAVLTLDAKAQKVALAALGDRCGSVVALEPATGKVLVLASSPTYNPNLVEGKFGLIARITAACSRPSPLVDRATAGLYVPGSIFKLVTAAAALDTGAFTPESQFKDKGYCIEYGKKVSNFADQRGPEVFGKVNFGQALQHSINSVFCQIGKRLGPGPVLEYAKRFGFYSTPALETPAGERRASGLYSNGRLFDPKDPASEVDPGRLAFGQERLQVTPLQMALVTAAIANGGVVMRPYLVDRIVSPGGSIVTGSHPREVGRAISPETATALGQMMEAVVRAGTGTAARIPGLTVAGKTGTAETGVRGRNTTWFVAFAGRDRPEVAVAVVLEEQSGTGGATAAPIARSVLQSLLSVPVNP